MLRHNKNIWRYFTSPLWLSLLSIMAVTVSSATVLQIDQNLKNIKLIESKFIPDVNVLPADSNINIYDENWQHVRRFMEDGLPVLELYGYKPQRDIPFTLIIPKIDVRTIEKPRLKEFMLEHMIPGRVFNTYADEDNSSFGNSNGHKIVFRKLEKTTTSSSSSSSSSSNSNNNNSNNNNNGDNSGDGSGNAVWLLNGFQILHRVRINDNLIALAIDGYLGDRKSPYSKRNIQEGSNSRYNEPQHLEIRNTTSNFAAHTKIEPILKESKASPLMSFLGSMKTGTKVFQHFLSKSNLTQIMDDGSFTVLIPTDNAFQRWHPIDWGFYPFSVQEFTESVLRNHFLPTQKPLRLNDIKNTDQLLVRTMGGETVIFRGQPTPTVNNVSIMSEYTLSNGNQVFIIAEVLFVSEAVVSKLHQMHKDKETPPLLAFPWFGAQFLSHSFLALERDPRFTQITRYLNNAEIAPHVSGANYTFFVPDDKAFEKLGFDKLSDDILASQRGVKMLLNHFVKGRLYNRDLRDNEVFETIGGGHIKITRNPGSNATSVNNAKIIESEVFVYNLGTMFYIDDILYSHLLREHVVKTKTRTNYGNGGRITTSGTPTDVEIVPNEFNHGENGGSNGGGGGDYSIHDDDFEDEIITPKALPVQFYELPK
uniref:FAS1 domain-containing protein n=1 Tax=Glossina austeni TaxID=7395 RepID=A0A1A9VH77_GLOAU